MTTVYLLSGPAGVGKSTTSSVLVSALPSSAYLSGDDISHMHINGRQKPWASEAERSLIWNNILSLTGNFLANGIDVVIDYIIFPNEAEWLKDNIREICEEVVYVVLWTDPETLLARDMLRLPEHRMGERCLILLEEFQASGLDRKHVLDTSLRPVEDVGRIVSEIMNGEPYRLRDEERGTPSINREKEPGS